MTSSKPFRRARPATVDASAPGPGARFARGIGAGLVAVAAVLGAVVAEPADAQIFPTTTTTRPPATTTTTEEPATTTTAPAATSTTAPAASSTTVRSGSSTSTTVATTTSISVIPSNDQAPPTTTAESAALEDEEDPHIPAALPFLSILGLAVTAGILGAQWWATRPQQR